MQFDVSALEPATLVFLGTVVLALVLAAFVLTVALAGLVVLGVANLTWNIVVSMLLAVVHGINHLWDRLLHHSPNVDIGRELQT